MKTAGTSFGAFLSSNFHRCDRDIRIEHDTIIPYHDSPFLPSLMGGHIHLYDALERWPIQQYKKIVLFREPRERLLSNINYNLTHAGVCRPIENITGEDILKKGLTWLAKQYDEYILEFIFNVQHRMTKLHQNTYGECSNNIRNFDSFGLTEYFESSINLISYETGLLPFIPQRSLNQTTTKPFENMPSEMDRFLELDQALYTEAKKEFKQRYGEMINRFNIENHQKKIKAYDIYSPSNSATKHKNNLELHKWISNRNFEENPKNIILGSMGIINYDTSSNFPIYSQVGGSFKNFVLKDQEAVIHLYIGKKSLKVYIKTPFSEKISKENIDIKTNGNQIEFDLYNNTIFIKTGRYLRQNVFLSIKYTGKSLYDDCLIKSSHIPYDMPDIGASIEVI